MGKIDQLEALPGERKKRGEIEVKI